MFGVRDVEGRERKGRAFVQIISCDVALAYVQTVCTNVTAYRSQMGCSLSPRKEVAAEAAPRHMCHQHVETMATRLAVKTVSATCRVLSLIMNAHLNV